MTEPRPWLWRLIGTMPSTNVRIAVSLVVLIATATRVVGWAWDPPTDWLIFLGVLLGVDVAQFASKRLTSSKWHETENTSSGAPSRG